MLLKVTRELKKLKYMYNPAKVMLHTGLITLLTKERDGQWEWESLRPYRQYVFAGLHAHARWLIKYFCIKRIP